jgi:hypothetical protein
VARIIERVRVGESTQIQREAPLSDAAAAAILEQHRQRVAAGEQWFVRTPYGGFGGHVPSGEGASVRRVSRLDDLRAVERKLQIPTGVHRDEHVRFDHALVAPGGVALIFLGSGAKEVFLSAFPVGGGRFVGYGRLVSRTGADGKLVAESPELKAEEIRVGGQTVVWDPDPTPPSTIRVHWPGTWFLRRDENSALRWEKDGLSYSLMGRSLTRVEAVNLFLSLRPIDEVER